MQEPWRRRRFWNLLQEAGDVVLAAGGPGEGVSVGRDVRRHQLGRLVPFGAAGIPDSVVVHSKAVRGGTHKGAESKAGLSPANQTPHTLPSHLKPGQARAALLGGEMSEL